MKVLKIDIDFKAPKPWRHVWSATRFGILKDLGFNVIHFKEIESSRGFNYFIRLDKDIDDETVNMLQFLLGDDHTRVKINAWRIERGVKRWNKIFDRKIYRKDAKTIDCWYCGNKIMIPKEILKCQKK